MPTIQEALIRQATLRALKARDQYSDTVAAGLTGTLLEAQQAVDRALLRYKGIGSLPDNKLAAMKGLDLLNGEIADVMSQMKRQHTLAWKGATKQSFQQGIFGGIAEFAAAQFPGYRDLKPDRMDYVAGKAFQIMDTDALDFLTEYNLVLAGDVGREVEGGIKRTLMGGIATGKSAAQIAEDMGSVVLDKESFRRAGGRVWPTAQQRMETIARTEILRAHNQGRIKFHQRVGVQKLEWLAVGDERMCAICGGLDGRVYPTDQFPQQPAHPNCRCTNVVAWPVTICGGG